MQRDDTVYFGHMPAMARKNDHPPARPPFPNPLPVVLERD